MADYGHDLLFGSFITPSARAPERVVALARLSEQAGLDLVTLQDHPYLPGFLDTWTLLSFLAAATSRITLVPGPGLVARGRAGGMRARRAADNELMEARSPAAASPAAATPAVARAAFRAGLRAPTANWSGGFAQANLVIVAQDAAQEFELFARRNPGPCPLLDVSAPGDPATWLAPGADLRTDLPAYRVWEHGRCVAEPGDITAWWRDDLVAFLTGCSFTFERALLAAGIPVRHQERGSNVAMYVTSRPCQGAGRFAGPMVVSMRPVPAGLVAAAAEVTAGFPAAHGAPVHAGDPAVLGIADLSRPDFGDPVPLRPGDVPVFWACGVTPQVALAAARLPLAITHAPGHMLITDVPDGELTLRH